MHVIFIAISAWMSHAETLEFFKDKELRFFDIAPTAHAPTTQGVSTPIPTTSPKFDWNAHLDPKGDEIFKEGDYSPPAPFVEVAKDPSPENITNWFQYLETKNKLLERLQEKLEAYQATRYGFNSPAPQVILDPDAKNVSVRMYYHSQCPHCKQMMGELKRLSEVGYFVELRQIDDLPSGRENLPFTWAKANAQDLKRFKIQAVPFTLIAHLKSGTYSTLQGFQTAETLIQTIKKGGSL